MHFRYGDVRVQVVAPVHSRVHFCRESALVNLTGSRNTLECRNTCIGGREYYNLYINGRLMMDGDVHHISTMGAELREGYGESVMDDEACRAAAEKVNAPCADISDGIERITPLLGLLNEGTYLIGDFELYPVRPDGTHALNSEGYYSLYHEEGKMSSGHGEVYDAPMYILPSQRAEVLNPERIRYYMDMFRQLPPHQVPRAVAMYLNGAVALLLDGHHKVAAAAALGLRVKTLVIFPVNASEALEKTVRNRGKLELCHGRWNYERDCFGIPGIGLLICDEQLRELTYVHNLGSLPVSDKEYSKISKEDCLPWGKVPDEFCGQLKNYPSKYTLQRGTMIPPDKIKKCMKSIMDAEYQFWKYKYSNELIAFNELFPDSPMLTEKDRAKLQKEALKL